MGVVNLTRDSFSDGGRYFDPSAAVAHARRLRAEGADIIELGPASTHPDAELVSAAEEQRRLAPVLDALLGEMPLGVDSYLPETQAYALARGVALLNDVRGFPHAELYPVLAAASAHLVTMHSVGTSNDVSGRAQRTRTDPSAVEQGVYHFFAQRVDQLVQAGVARGRLVLDPGMGFFLGDTPEPSVRMLNRVGTLQERFGLPVLISVTRKSFLGALTGRAVGERGAASLAAELYAVQQGVAYIRTHDVAQLRDGLLTWRALRNGAP